MSSAGDTNTNAGDANTNNRVIKEDNEEESDTEEEEDDSASPANQISSELMQNSQGMAASEANIYCDSEVSSDNFIDCSPEAIERRVRALKNLQLEAAYVEAKFYKEVHALQVKYKSHHQAIRNKRYRIVIGSYEPNDEECEWNSENEDEDTDKKDEGKSQDDDKEVDDLADDMKAAITFDGYGDRGGIPEFWLTVFKNVPLLKEMVKERDEPVLRYLDDITVELSVIGTPLSFTLRFLFSEVNPYFENKILIKEYKLRSEPDEKDPFAFEGPEIMSCTASNIRWNKGKNVTMKRIKKKHAYRYKASCKATTRQVPTDSFFNFFSPPEVDDDSELDSDTETLLSNDFEIGHLLKERIIPRAVLYYTGEARDDLYEDDGEEDEEGNFPYDSYSGFTTSSHSDLDPVFVAGMG